MIAEYRVEMKGIKNAKGIENMRKVLQVYLDDLAHCFALDISVDVYHWGSDGLDSDSMQVRGLPLPHESGGAGEQEISGSNLQEMP